ncbi:non-ribosomal peptide synthetase domain protein [Mycobacterium ulcerans str. Harvey]|uniref:Non-ribosomal peptide synthetase domain protein n=1 Tax=Mycobacterium ulcerans str. Harvey TaxID=1299332 RepID=A0ABN0QLX2_MYCUL|nr:non-ribosomal peptide synthetase domain protein [Mycobacterium ulcerans str. Harvey]
MKRPRWPKHYGDKPTPCSASSPPRPARVGVRKAPAVPPGRGQGRPARVDRPLRPSL